MTLKSYADRENEKFRNELLALNKKRNAHLRDINLSLQKNNVHDECLSIMYQTSIIIETLFEKLGIDDLEENQK